MHAAQNVYGRVRISGQLAVKSKNVNLPHGPASLAFQPMRNTSTIPPGTSYAVTPSATSAPTKNSTNSITSVQMTVAMPPISVQIVATMPIRMIDSASGLSPVVPLSCASGPERITISTCAVRYTRADCASTPPSTNSAVVIPRTFEPSWCCM